MAKRVYEIAKELELSSRQVIAALSGLGVVAKSHSSTVENAVVEKLRKAHEEGTIEKLTAAGKSSRARPQRPTPAQAASARAATERPSAERAPGSRPEPERAPARRRAAAERAAPPARLERPSAERVPASAASAAAIEEDGGGTATKTKPRKALRVDRGITVSALAQQLGVTPAEIVKKLFLLGEAYTLAQSLTDEAAEIVANEYGYDLTIVAPGVEEEEEEAVEDDPALLVPRPPVITVMGHVDHGKTLLLDKIRQTDVVAQEHGGITQHIGAYQVRKNGRAVTFIDTPGHEAFTQMRARGAQVTDIAVLVVAADDGVKPQTVEALSHARAAKVPIVVAVNKVDKPDADPNRVRQQLTERELVPEEWGGDVPFVDVSAKTGDHLEDLLDVLLLVADIQELKANDQAPARGAVIEAHLDRGRGPVATVLVQRGTLRLGDALVCGTAWARVRAMLDDMGEPLTEAGPGTPAQVLGFDSVPSAGDDFRVTSDERKARAIAQERQAKLRAAELVAHKRVRLEDIFEQAQEGELTELNVVLKADVQGSLEAVQDALEKMKIEEVSVRVIHRAVGGINENDVTLAAASDAIVLGFNVRPDPKARAIAEEQGVDMRLYQIIYKLVEDVEAALKGMLKPVFKEFVLGRAVVRATFKVPKIGVIAGCYLEDGIARRGSKVRLVRDGVVVADTTISSLRRFKDDVREVQSGFECGIGLEGYQDLKEGDVLEMYEEREVPRD
ncbi:MAG TPA: translation initiation factor IF-2 [Actinomycetota bacterium]